MKEEEINEEEVRGKILLSFLHDLRFDLSEISFENRFTIRLGRTKSKLGKSDILIKRNRTNLFVIELKNNSVTITQDKISEKSDYWKDGFTLSSENDLKIRCEALTSFVSFSPENLRTFCQHQVNDRMGTIVGSIDNPYAKFVRELYVPMTTSCEQKLA